jgi:hypothetical protein
MRGDAAKEIFMARVATVAKKTGAVKPARRVPDRGKGKSAASTAGKKTAVKEEDDISSLAQEALDLDRQEREQFAVSNVVYVSIVGRMSQATMKSKPGYVPGAKLGDIITSTKENLGEETTVTVLGVYKLYGVYEPDRTEGGKKVQGKLKRYVMPDDAAQIRGLAQEAGLEVTNFDTTLPNGNTMRPMHWVHLYLHDKPEITNAVISLRSTGNKIATEIAKIIQQTEVQHSAEIRFSLSHREESNEAGEWYLPDFTLLDQRNFRVEDGQFLPVKGGFTKQELYAAIKLSSDRRKDYLANKTVGKTDVKALFGSAPRAALPAGDSAYEDEDDGEEEDDGEGVRF